MDGSTIYHVYKDGMNYYFGSIAAIFDVFTPDDLNVAPSTLYNYGITETHPYKNKVCIINRGTLYRKKKNK